MFMVAFNLPWNIIVNFIYRNSIPVCICANMLMSNIFWGKTTCLSSVLRQGFFKVFLLEKKLGSIFFFFLSLFVKPQRSSYHFWGIENSESRLISKFELGSRDLTEAATRDAKKFVLKDFAKSTRKHLCQSLFFNKVAGFRLWHRCFPVNFAKCLRTPFAMSRESYSESCERSKMELFVKMISGFQPLTIVAKSFILEVQQGPEYDSVLIQFCFCII